MRFDDLFADLSAQYDALLAAELEAEVADRTRSARARVGLGDRLRAGRGQPIRVRLQGGVTITGQCRAVGPDWVHLRPASGGDVVAATAAILEVAGLPAAGRAETSPTAERLGLRFVLRGLARSRAAVRVGLIDGTDVVGTLESVGSDVCDLVERRSDDVSLDRRSPASRTIALAALVLVEER